MIATDTFTEVLRYVVWIGLFLLAVFVIGTLVALSVVRWLHSRHDWDVWDVSKRDNGPTDEELADDGWHEGTHVHVLDYVPRGWLNEWR